MDSSMLFAFVVCLCVVYFIQRLFSRHKYPPGPIGLPFVGHLPFLSRKPYLYFQRVAKTYGNIFSIRLGSADVVILNDFESTKQAFSQDAFMGRPEELPFGLNKETIETGAFFGVPWKDQRRFSLHQLKDLGLGKSKMEGHIQEEVCELISLLEKTAGKPVCICDILIPSMSNNIASMMFGKRLNYDDPISQMMTRTLKEGGAAIGHTSWQLFFPWIKRICLYLDIGDLDRVHRIQQEMKDYIWKERNEHEETLDPTNIRDFIDGYLIEIKNRKEDPAFCKKVLQDSVNGFFGAGSETVRLTVEWLSLTAAVHQDAQHRVQHEIDEVVGKDQPITWLDHKSMPFTVAFIMELMRWRPVIPINILRSALFDGEINGYFIPKRTILIANFWAILHDRQYWGEDADEFRPERFLTEDGQVKKCDRFIPFSIGKRQCPGEPMAKVEVFLYFASILQKFHIRVPESKVIDFEGNIGIGLMPRAQELIFSKRT